MKPNSTDDDAPLELDYVAAPSPRVITKKSVRQANQPAPAKATVAKAGGGTARTRNLSASPPAKNARAPSPDAPAKRKDTQARTREARPRGSETREMGRRAPKKSGSPAMLIGGLSVVAVVVLAVVGVIGVKNMTRDATEKEQKAASHGTPPPLPADPPPAAGSATPVPPLTTPEPSKPVIEPTKPPAPTPEKPADTPKDDLDKEDLPTQEQPPAPRHDDPPEDK